MKKYDIKMQFFKGKCCFLFRNFMKLLIRYGFIYVVKILNVFKMFVKIIEIQNVWSKLYEIEGDVFGCMFFRVCEILLNFLYIFLFWF